MTNEEFEKLTTPTTIPVIKMLHLIASDKDVMEWLEDKPEYSLPVRVRITKEKFLAGDYDGLLVA